ncbi:MAG: hypothetical protein ABJK20_09060 [Halieaceae bacterium]
MASLTRFLSLLFCMLFASLALADALMINRSVEASSLAQYYIDERGVQVDLEIGLSSLEDFRNLMPDTIYRELGYDAAPLEQRLRTFFSKDLGILVEGEPLPGYVRNIGPGNRVLRDPITGTPLPIQDDAPQVIRAQLVYPFPMGSRPAEVVFTASRLDLGFVAYHKGVAVNDYRYLASGYKLTLDWQDPWYSSFNTRNLARQYSAPMSAFIYVENFEVRKEVIIRPKDLQRWVDLGLAGRSDIPVALQPGIRETVGEFLSRHQPVTIDGKPAEGILESVNFLDRTLTSSRVIDPPELLQLDSAIVGAIFVYPRSELPQQVTMDWNLWDERIQRIPVSAVDQAGPLPSFLEADWRTLEWSNYLKNPEVPTLAVVESPVQAWRLLLGQLLPLFAALALISIAWFLYSLGKRKSLALAAATAALFTAASVAAIQLGGDNSPQQGRASAIVGDLLHNIYRSFDYREEADIYDVLALSVSGELLTDIFLETKRSLVLANQGGAEAKVKDVLVNAVEVLPDDADDSFLVEVDWTVQGSVGHWGHIHQRSNRYLARLRVGVDGERWKLQEMSVLQEERL